MAGKTRIVFAVTLSLFLFATWGTSWGTHLYIAHTNDLHSHLLGFAPNADYSPDMPGDDETVGGWARIYTVLKSYRTEHPGGVLVLDAGDFLMGSLFHTVSPLEGGELRLLGLMGYDVVTLGNHEFDLQPAGLAAILLAAHRKGRIPKIVASNIQFSRPDSADDRLEEAFSQIKVAPYTIVNRNGLRIGIFGLMGRDAAQVAPFASPVSFSDPVKKAKEVVKELRDKRKVDLVIALSHSGLSDHHSGEDVQLAKEVKGIDVIISGHTHTVLKEPIRIGDCLIVQAGCYGRYVGLLDLEVKNGRERGYHYQLKKIDDSIIGDRVISSTIEDLSREVERKFLSPKGLSLHEPLAEFDFPIKVEPWGESQLGDLITDAIRWAIDRVEAKASDPLTITRVTFESNGLIRDPLVPGKRGLLYISDLFRAFPLGFGPDGGMGYPLVSVFLHASEIKKALEVMATVAPMKGTDYVLQVSGIKFTYNSKRVPFDRVSGILIQGPDGAFKPLDTSSRNRRLYKVGANLYNATFLKVIGGFTHGILNIVPKDRHGRPIPNLRLALVDRDPNAPGIQELKEWRALVDYVRQLPDLDGNGLPNIPESYKRPQGRIQPQPSWNPGELFRNASWITWAALAVLVTALLVLCLIILAAVRLLSRSKGVVP